jgi:hypothetical protein
MPKKFYSQTLAVPASEIAGKNPIEGPALGGYASPTVPEEPATVHGLGTLSKPFKHGQVPGAHGYGHPPHAKKGHYRLSGAPNAHQLGKNHYKVPGNVNRP